MYFQPSVVDDGIIVEIFDYQGTALTSTSQLECFEVFNVGYQNKQGFLSLFSFQDLVFKTDVHKIDLDNLYLQVVYRDEIDYYKIVNKIQTQALTYKISYQSERWLEQPSTFSAGRYNYFMPKWSTAYINTISVYSKIFYPVFEQLENSLLTSMSSLQNNILHKQIRDSRTLKSKPNYVKQDQTLLTETNSTLKSKYKEVVLTETEKVEPFSLKLEDAVFPFINSLPYLYFTNQSEKKVEFLVRGLNFQNRYVQEVVTVNPISSRVSNYQFKNIIEVVGDEYEDVYISNCIDGKTLTSIKDHVRFSLYTNITKDYDYSDSQLRVEGTKNFLDVFVNPERNNPIFPLFLEDTSEALRAFLTKQGQVITLKGQTLSSGLIREPMEVFNGLHPSNNNNSVVVVSHDTKTVGDTFSFVINPSELLSRTESVYTYVQVQINEEKFYLDASYKLNKDKVRFEMSNFSNRLYIDYQYAPNTTYSLTVITEETEYVASTYSYTAELEVILEGVEGFIYTGEGYKLQKQGKWYDAELRTNTYMYDDTTKQIYTESRDASLEVMYKDYTTETV